MSGFCEGSDGPSSCMITGMFDHLSNCQLVKQQACTTSLHKQAVTDRSVSEQAYLPAAPTLIISG